MCTTRATPASARPAAHGAPPVKFADEQGDRGVPSGFTLIETIVVLVILWLISILALIVASLGFLSKLVAEAVEEMSMKPVEAVRATGSPFLSVVIMGVLPQVFARFIGFSAYQLDSNLRNSALVGIVGGGGIGATLLTAFQRFDYDFVLTIVLAIIAIVMVGEIVSGWMRRMFQ